MLILWGGAGGVNISLLSFDQSLLDDYGLADVSSAAEKVKQAVENEDFLKATELWSVAESVVEEVSTTLLTRPVRRI